MDTSSESVSASQGALRDATGFGVGGANISVDGMRTSISVGTLIAIALGSGALWRLEVNARDWSGLTWASYFHWAIPAAVSAFLLWALCVSRVPSRGYKIAFAVMFMLSSVPLYWWSLLILRGAFAFGSNNHWLVWSGFTAVPVALAVMAYFSKLESTWTRRFASIVLWVAAMPLALAWLKLIRSPYADEIHTIKTGTIVPLLVFALGMQLLPPAAR